MKINVITIKSASAIANAIVLGNGTRLKRRPGGTRGDFEHLGRRSPFLHVKVNPRWDEDRSLYRDIGLDWAD